MNLLVYEPILGFWRQDQINVIERKRNTSRWSISWTGSKYRTLWWKWRMRKGAWYGSVSLSRTDLEKRECNMESVNASVLTEQWWPVRTDHVLLLCDCMLLLWCWCKAETKKEVLSTLRFDAKDKEVHWSDGPWFPLVAILTAESHR